MFAPPTQRDPPMTAPHLLLDYAYDHEEALRDKVFLTQPIGGGAGEGLHLGPDHGPGAAYGDAPESPEL